MRRKWNDEVCSSRKRRVLVGSRPENTVRLRATSVGRLYGWLFGAFLSQDGGLPDGPISVYHAGWRVANKPSKRPSFSNDDDVDDAIRRTTTIRHGVGNPAFACRPDTRRGRGEYSRALADDLQTLALTQLSEHQQRRSLSCVRAGVCKSSARALEYSPRPRDVCSSWHAEAGFPTTAVPPKKWPPLTYLLSLIIASSDCATAATTKPVHYQWEPAVLGCWSRDACRLGRLVDA